MREALRLESDRSGSLVQSLRRMWQAANDGIVERALAIQRSSECPGTRPSERFVKGLTDPAARAKWTPADMIARDVNFSDLQLSEADFSGCDVSAATFRAAELRAADFRDAKGVSMEAFGGANLEGARFREGADQFELLSEVDEVSAYLQTLFKIILVTCAFALLTVLSMRDENMILHNAHPSTQLPFIQASVSLSHVAWIVPVIVFFLMSYLLTYLHHLWILISFLPAVFPDGTALDRRTYPLLFNCLIRKNLKRLDDEPPIRLEIVISYVQGFGIPLLTLFAFWVRYLKLHWWPASLLQIATLAGVISLMMYFIQGSRRMMRGQAMLPWATKSSVAVPLVLYHALKWGTGVAVVMACLTWLVFNGYLVLTTFP